MATFKVTRFASSSDTALTISLVSTAFNNDGDKFVKPVLVDMPVWFNDTFVCAPAIVSDADAAAVTAALDKIEATDTNAADKVLVLKQLVASLPKRIWVRSLMRATDLDVIQSDGTSFKTTKKWVEGTFADKFRAAIGTNTNPTAAVLQAAITKASKKNNSQKEIVVHSNFYAYNNKGKKYDVVKYDLSE